MSPTEKILNGILSSDWHWEWELEWTRQEIQYNLMGNLGQPWVTLGNLGID